MNKIKELNLFQHLLSLMLICFSVFQLWAVLFSSLDAIKFRSLHIIFLFVLTIFIHPFRKISYGLSLLWDVLCLIASLGAFGYLLLRYDELTLSGGWYEFPDYAAAALGLVITFEAARRVVPGLALLAFAFLSYPFLGRFISGPFGHTGFSLSRVLDHLFWGSQGLLGVGAGVSASYIFIFILLGAFLRLGGFSAFVNDLALAVVGRSAGGPAKVAVLSSALMGMINGSALANVAATGTITIPLMKRAGYKPEFAAAVEAVSSTGGQFAPPVMGAVGFIMAEFLGVAYTKVMLAAVIPAFLYYLALIAAVHFEARKMGLKGVSRENIHGVLYLLRKRGWQLLPLGTLIGILFCGFTPAFAACAALFAAVIASWCSPQTRMGPREILKALEEGARSALSVGVACVIIGVIIGVVSLTGLGLAFGNAVLSYMGEGRIYLAGAFVMVMGVVLGMGVPGVAAYVIVSTTAVPVLHHAGVELLSAHMFCLIYACLANITPPVALSAYVASGIAGCNQNKAALLAVRLGLVGFLLPFFFLNNPLLLMCGDPISIAWAFCTATVGVTALAAGLEGWLFFGCSYLQRILFLSGALCLIDPGFLTDVAGFLLIAFGGALNYRASQAILNEKD